MAIILIIIGSVGPLALALLWPAGNKRSTGSDTWYYGGDTSHHTGSHH